MRKNIASIFISILVAVGVIVTGCEDSPVKSSKENSDTPDISAVTSGIHSTSCDLTVPDDHATVQMAINNAGAGDVVCVEAGTYAEDVSVNKDITLQGTADPTGSNAAMLDGTISVSEDGAEVTHLKVAPSTTKDLEEMTLYPAGILITASDVLIEANFIEGIEGDATGDNSSGTVHGIQVWNDGPEVITDIKVRDNIIENIHNLGDANEGWPNYGGAVGVKAQGVVKDVEVTGNNVQGVHSAGWVYGISLTHTGNDPNASPPENITVKMNTLEDLNDGSVYDVFVDPFAAPYPGVAFAIDDTFDPEGPGGADADQATVELNNFLNTPIGTQNKDQVNTLVAECNYWGHASGPSAADNNANKGAQVAGDVDYRPWSVRKTTTGNNPAKSCVGGKKNPGNGK